MKVTNGSTTPRARFAVPDSAADATVVVNSFGAPILYDSDRHELASSGSRWRP